jgi:hypothetical protein
MSLGDYIVHICPNKHLSENQEISVSLSVSFNDYFCLKNEQIKHSQDQVIDQSWHAF